MFRIAVSRVGAILFLFTAFAAPAAAWLFGLVAAAALAGFAFGAGLATENHTSGLITFAGNQATASWTRLLFWHPAHLLQIESGIT